MTLWYRLQRSLYFLLSSFKHLNSVLQNRENIRCITYKILWKVLCYSLNMKNPWKLCMLHHKAKTNSATLGSSGNLKRWTLTEPWWTLWTCEWTLVNMGVIGWKFLVVFCSCFFCFSLCFLSFLSFTGQSSAAIFPHHFGVLSKQPRSERPGTESQKSSFLFYLLSDVLIITKR